MDYVIERTHILDHERFLAAGVHARDLWEWGMKYSGKFELDGELPMHAILASPWGYGGRANIRAAAKLVEVGLWERTDTGFRILRWSEQGNKTRAQLELSREAERAKKAAQRRKSSPPPASVEVFENCPPGTPDGTPHGTPAGVLNSLSNSLSGSRSSSRIQDQPDRSPTPPAWFAEAAEAAAMIVGPILELPARWVSYRASRERKNWAQNHGDAVSWLTEVVRSERQRAAKTGGGPRGDRQPLGDPKADWLKTGSDL